MNQQAHPIHDASGVHNLVVLRGAIASEPVTRTLAGGATVVQFDVTTTLISSADEPAGRSNVSVPIAWTDPPATTLAALGQGDEVVVVGSVRRRFFRSGGMTQSRTEVVPEHVVPARRTKTVRSMLAAAAEALVC